MLSMSVTTKLKPEVVIIKAVDFFGVKGIALTIGTQTDTNIYLYGGGGSVDISAHADGKKTTVDIASVEWDYQVKEFIAKII